MPDTIPAAIAASTTKEAITRFLAVARIEIGTQEVPKGSNNGPKVRDYLAHVGLGPGYPWCAAFVAWCGLQAAQAGQDWPLPLTADCDVLLSFARKRDILHGEPAPGDVFLVRASINDAIHTGIVVSVNEDGTLTTIEGNSNSDGGREGYAVVKNPRRVLRSSGRLPLLFVRWATLISPPANPWRIRVAGEPDGKTVEALMVQGQAYGPVRDLLTRLHVPALDTLKYEAENNALTYAGTLLPAAVALREGVCWAAVRPLAPALGFDIAVDGAARTITLSRPSGAAKAQ